jgi:hypothetical protein
MLFRFTVLGVVCCDIGKESNHILGNEQAVVFVFNPFVPELNARCSV